MSRGDSNMGRWVMSMRRCCSEACDMTGVPQLANHTSASVPGSQLLSPDISERHNTPSLTSSIATDNILAIGLRIMSSAKDVPALLRFLSQEAKVPLAQAMSKIPALQAAQLNT